jgi:hypothetical protein
VLESPMEKGLAASYDRLVDVLVLLAQSEEGR